jgi:hypothetical protein
MAEYKLVNEGFGAIDIGNPEGLSCHQCRSVFLSGEFFDFINADVTHNENVKRRTYYLHPQCKERCMKKFRITNHTKSVWEKNHKGEYIK